MPGQTDKPALKHLCAHSVGFPDLLRQISEILKLGPKAIHLIRVVENFVHSHVDFHACGTHPVPNILRFDF